VWLNKKHERRSTFLPLFLDGVATLQAELSLSQMKLSGTIPGDALGTCINLQRLDLNDNLLEGGVPVGLRKLTKLKVLNLAKNCLTGSLPSWLFSELPILARVSLQWQTGIAYKHPQKRGFTGMIPSTVGCCPGLALLNLSHNGLSGACFVIRFSSRWGMCLLA
jgi:hypothetical protein